MCRGRRRGWWPSRRSLLHDAGKLCIIRGNETKEGRVARRSLHYKQGSNEMATKKVAKKAPAKKAVAKKPIKKVAKKAKK